MSRLGAALSGIPSHPGLWTFWVVQMVGLVFLQKFGLPAGGGKVLAINLPLALGSLAAWWLLRPQSLSLNPRRTVLYALFCGTAVLSQVFGGRDFSPTAMGLMLALYFPLVFRYELQRDDFLRCLRVFQLFMLFIAFDVFALQIMQKLWSAASWPDLNRLAPEALLVPGFNYYRETGWNTGVFQPHAVVFLEVSIVSQFLALAVVIEFEFFKRWGWLAIYVAALLATFAGTGLLMLVFVAPFVMRKLSPKLLLGGLVAAVVLGAVGASIGWLDQVMLRLSEVNQPGSSGYYRFTVPYMQLTESLSSGVRALFGMGAGNTIESNDDATVVLAVNKLISEYGMVTTVAFFTLFFHALFEKTPSRLLAVALAVFYNLCAGALSVPVYVMTYIMLGTFLRIAPEPERTGARASLQPSVRVSIRSQPALR
ncbi:MAG TPA: hypothetical protein VI299_23525 [Polyangiales bacterium]